MKTKLRLLREQSGLGIHCLSLHHNIVHIIYRVLIPAKINAKVPRYVALNTGMTQKPCSALLCPAQFLYALLSSLCLAQI